MARWRLVENLSGTYRTLPEFYDEAPCMTGLLQ